MKNAKNIVLEGQIEMDIPKAPAKKCFGDKKECEGDDVVEIKKKKDFFKIFRREAKMCKKRSGTREDRRIKLLETIIRERKKKNVAKEVIELEKLYRRKAKRRRAEELDRAIRKLFTEDIKKSKEMAAEVANGNK